MNASDRKPFHVVLVDSILGYPLEGVRAISELIEAAIIPTGHQEIIAAIDERLEGESDDLLKMALSEIRQVVVDQQTEAERRLAEKAGQVSDKDKVTVMAKVIDKMVDYVPCGLIGEHAIAMGRFLLLYQELSGRIQRARTSSELQQVLAELR